MCDEEAARAVVGDDVARGEVLLVADDPEGPSVGLYIAEGALEHLRTKGAEISCATSRTAFWLAAEGVSHFIYLAFRSMNEESVSQLELELQAEVDKYASTVLMKGLGVGAIQERSRIVRHHLFDEVEFLDDASSEEGARYRRASAAAARYTKMLEEKYVIPGDDEGLIRELRRFYRVGGLEKLRLAERSTQLLVTQ